MKKIFADEVAVTIYGVIIALFPLTGYLIGSNFADTMEMTSWKWRSFARIILGGIFPMIGLFFPTVAFLKEKEYDKLFKLWLITLAIVATIYPAFNNLKGPYSKKLKIEKIECAYTKYSLDECKDLKIAYLEGNRKVHYESKSEIAKKISIGRFLNVKMIDKDIIWVDKIISD